MPVKLSSTGGGSVTLDTPSTASNYTVTLPAANTTLADTSSTQTLTNKTLTAAGSNTVEATSGPTSTQLAGQRNKIINGAMMIDQRNAGAAVTANAGTAFSCDRWRAYLNGTGSVTMTQSATVPNANFTNSIASTVTGVGTPSESAITQTIEGYNIADLGFGTGDAKALTASFWVRSSVTGTFCFSLRQGSGSRSFVSPFTISSANTWQQVVVSIPGDVTGTYNSTNGAGLIVEVCIGASTLITSTVNTWQAGNYVATSAQTNLASTNGATFYLTGVQLEKGSVATPFEFRPYGAELALCQRYYWQVNSETSYAGLGSGVMNTATTARIFMPYPVSMRAAPTVSITSPSSFIVSQGTDLTPTNLTPYANSKTCMFDMATGTGTAGRGAVLLFANVATGSIQATAEL